jgi:eukaryotic-like serine/threonine-protein kinase
MQTPKALLKFAAKALLNAAGGGIAGDLIVEVLPEVAQDIWEWWSRNRAEGERRAEVEALAQAQAADVREAVTAVVREVAADQPAAVRQALTTQLSRLPSAIRASLQRPDDPGGTTVPPDQPLQNADDLLTLLSAGRRGSGAAAGEAVRAIAERPSPDGTSPVRITLKVTAGPHKGESFAFVGHDTFLVGRSQRAHFQLPMKDKYFSRIHFMVEVNPPSCRLMDMGSRNGTYVNGQKVEKVDLQDGDQIRAGHTILRVTVAGSMPPPAPAAPTIKAAPAEPADSLPQPIQGYRILRELGRGGMGVVYLAERSADGAKVALKTIIPAVSGSRAQVERFLREARTLQQLDHPHIVAFREMGESNRRLYFAMDFVPGPDAGRLVKTSGPLPVGRAVGLACQMLDALAFAHGQRFVHRDIKPANLLLATDGGRDVARLADFGLARVYQASQLSGLTMTGDVGGTVAFMAPEQITNYREVKPPADQYAAAASLYNLLTGKYVFDLPANPQQRLLMILQDEPVPVRERRPDLPGELAGVIHRALAKEPGDRFGGAGEFRKALLPFRG